MATSSGWPDSRIEGNYGPFLFFRIENTSLKKSKIITQCMNIDRINICKDIFKQRTF